MSEETLFAEALERLVQLYEATGKKEEAIKWRDILRSTTTVPNNKKS